MSDSPNPVAIALARYDGKQSELAKALGVSKQTVSAWARGTNKVSPTFVLTFERITGVPRWAIRPDLYPPKEK